MSVIIGTFVTICCLQNDFWTKNHIDLSLNATAIQIRDAYNIIRKRDTNVTKQQTLFLFWNAESCRIKSCPATTIETITLSASHFRIFQNSRFLAIDKTQLIRVPLWDCVMWHFLHKDKNTCINIDYDATTRRLLAALAAGGAHTLFHL